MINLFVMAGLVPAIHVFLGCSKDMDARHKAGHDELIGCIERVRRWDRLGRSAGFLTLRARRLGENPGFRGGQLARGARSAVPVQELAV